MIDVIKKENQWTVVAEIAGEASPARLKEIQDLVKAELKEDVTIYFKPSNDFYANDARIIGDDTLLEMFYKENSLVLAWPKREIIAYLAPKALTAKATRSSGCLFFFTLFINKL